MTQFNNLRTVKNVQNPLKPAAIHIYNSIFPKCKIEDLRENGINVHILDQHFGIDKLIQVQSGQKFSIQEKYRDYRTKDCYVNWHDFTQEVENGNGTEGEWFKLNAQLYFYGWGDPTVPIFWEWFILSVSNYKNIVESFNGIENMGPLFSNIEHGRAKFRSIKFEKIKPAFLYFGTALVFMKRLSDTTFSEPILLGNH